MKTLPVVKFVVIAAASGTLLFLAIAFAKERNDGGYDPNFDGNRDDSIHLVLGCGENKEPLHVTWDSMKKALDALPSDSCYKVQYWEVHDKKHEAGKKVKDLCCKMRMEPQNSSDKSNFQTSGSHSTQQITFKSSVTATDAAVRGRELQALKNFVNSLEPGP